MPKTKDKIIVYSLIPRGLHADLKLLREKQGGRTLASLVREALEDIVKKYSRGGPEAARAGLKDIIEKYSGAKGK